MPESAPSPIRWPAHIPLARTGTPVEFLSRLSEEVGTEIWIKRDDLTGVALSGNKIRKLEFLLAEAVELGARTVLTCGGIQSNHARATAVAAARLGLASHLYLRGTAPEVSEGNVLLDRLVGAEITWVTPEEYRRADELMADAVAGDERVAYPIPEGGSNALGTLGYARAVEEILRHEAELGFSFDAVLHATGSGGTTAGLLLGAKAFGLKGRVHGVNVCDDEQYFREKIGRILTEATSRYAPGLSISENEISILDGHVGPGYALCAGPELATIRRVARTEGLFLDPVYTGKAFHGMLEELKGGRLAGLRRILFVHTGGIYGLFPQADALLSF